MKFQAFVPFATYPEANADALAAHAAAVAAGIGVTIRAVAINADIPDVSNALSKLLLDTPKLIRQAEAASRQQGRHLLALVKEKSDLAGVDLTTAVVNAPIAALGEAAALDARYSDLSLVGWEAGNTTSRAIAEAVIFGSGRPAILLPELWEPSPFDHVAIAWDGSRVAARAVADARLFLERATRILVLTVLDEKPLKEKAAGERLATALRERGLNAEAFEIMAQDCPIAETLQQTTIEKGGQLLVMGGYGHSRLRDFVLGGATQGVLSDLLMPVLLSH
ncbi:universal stress protein [Pseudaminobacter arsenicus]|uniref:Universal stress protein n=1 Tax=Borborobacter arsenicus TaxID=1851146 RepID=A0A432V1C9_9HYPH|nr:universal stress protein [Pseudaminobacter arsenicus]RUM95979.1 universal stress protein [Pseudaminobacter arsenicus]